MSSGTICAPVVVDPDRVVRIEQVVQSADAPAPKRFAHFHDVVEQVWFEQIEGLLISEDGRFPLGSGTAVLLPPMRHHDFELRTGARAWERWLGSSEQPRAIAKWSGCRFHAAARSGWLKST